MQATDNRLSTSNHDRDVAGLTYVYPVISRRAGGVSVGINLNPNNACNWQCVYCQVPDLSRGSAPDIDLDCLELELASMLDQILNGDFMATKVPEDCRKLCDIAISGNGEPTSCKVIHAVIEMIVGLMEQFSLKLPLRLISNGSYMHKPHVQTGLRFMAAHAGEVWIKVDSATDEGILRINGIKLPVSRLYQQVETAAKLCPTWIQTCMFTLDGLTPSSKEISSYLEFLSRLKSDDIPIQGVLLYGLARPSHQDISPHLATVDADWLQDKATRIRQLGIEVNLAV